jgi:hypothetical protein
VVRLLLVNVCTPFRGYPKQLSKGKKTMNINNKKRTAFFMLLLSLLLPFTASATPIMWTLNDFEFNDGGSAIGSFVFDADTGVFSEVNITTTAGSTLSGDTYGFEGPYADRNSGSFGTSITADYTDQLNFFFDIDGYMSNAGGTLDVFGFNSSAIGDFGWGEGICGDPKCGDYDDVLTSRYYLANSTPTITGATVDVPSPGTLPLLMLGLIATGLVRRKS